MGTHEKRGVRVRKRRFAAGAALAVSAVSLTSGPAHAASVGITLTTQIGGDAGALGVTAIAVVPASPSIETFTYNFGDGTTITCGNADPDPDCAEFGGVTTLSLDGSHYYAKPGTYQVTFTMTVANGDTSTATTSVTTQGSDYTPYGPTRILDTRKGTGVAKAAPVPANGTVRLKIAGNGSIPSNVTAVALNITVVSPTRSGYAEVYPDGSPRPAVSNVNFGPGQTIANSIIVPVTDGYVDLVNASAGSTELLADVTGYFSQVAASGYTPLTPDRLLDTTKGIGAAKGALPADKSLSLTVAGADDGQLPSSGITAVVLNVTVTQATGNGDLTAYPGGKPKPGTSNLNFKAGDVRAASVLVPVGADGKIDIANGGSTGATQVLADVAGYFSADSTNSYVPAAATRVVDTRKNLGDYGQCVAIDMAQLPGGPDDVAALITNMTVTQTESSGWLAEVPSYDGPGGGGSHDCDDLNPTTSNVNWTGPNTTVANFGIATPAKDDSVAFYFNDSAGSPPELIVDAFGYFADDANPA